MSCSRRFCAVVVLAIGFVSCSGQPVRQGRNTLDLLVMQVGHPLTSLHHISVLAPWNHAVLPGVESAGESIHL
jgi:hypothetical protein